METSPLASAGRSVMVILDGGGMNNNNNATFIQRLPYDPRRFAMKNTHTGYVSICIIATYAYVSFDTQAHASAARARARAHTHTHTELELSLIHI